MVQTLNNIINQLDDLFLFGRSNLDQIKYVIQSYDSDDWKQYKENLLSNSLDNSSYHKIKLHQNNNYEIVLIIWNSYAQTKIHDHPDNGCVMKLLEGKLMEDSYLNNLEENKIKFHQRIILLPGQISHKISNQVLHQILCLREISTSIHIYLPPGHTPNYFVL
jgi:predicted metal-dependent enzyme (double-stranded beta helix superfamily)